MTLRKYNMPHSPLDDGWPVQPGDEKTVHAYPCCTTR